MQSPLLILFCSIGLLLSSTLNASETTSNAAHLHQLRLSLQGSLGDFYLLYGVDTDPAHSQSIDHYLTLANAHLLMLGETVDPTHASALEKIRQQWRAYTDLLGQLSAQVQAQGDVDGRSIAELIRLNSQLDAACATFATSLPAPPADTALAQRGRSLELLLQSLTTSYIAYNVGANTLGGDGQGIDQLTEQFTSGLTQLRDNAQSADDLSRLGDIQSKWRYIEPSLREYQKTAIPSLVSRYSARIIEDMAQLQLAEQTPTP